MATVSRSAISGDREARTGSSEAERAERRAEKKAGRKQLNRDWSDLTQEEKLEESERTGIRRWVVGWKYGHVVLFLAAVFFGVFALQAQDQAFLSWIIGGVGLAAIFLGIDAWLFTSGVAKR